MAVNNYGEIIGREQSVIDYEGTLGYIDNKFIIQDIINNTKFVNESGGDTAESLKVTKSPKDPKDVVTLEYFNSNIKELEGTLGTKVDKINLEKSKLEAFLEKKIEEEFAVKLSVLKSKLEAKIEDSFVNFKLKPDTLLEAQNELLKKQKKHLSDYLIFYKQEFTKYFGIVPEEKKKSILVKISGLVPEVNNINDSLSYILTNRKFLELEKEIKSIFNNPVYSVLLEYNKIHNYLGPDVKELAQKLKTKHDAGIYNQFKNLIENYLPYEFKLPAPITGEIIQSNIKELSNALNYGHIHFYYCSAVLVNNLPVIYYSTSHCKLVSIIRNKEKISIKIFLKSFEAYLTISGVMKIEIVDQRGTPINIFSRLSLGNPIINYKNKKDEYDGIRKTILLNKLENIFLTVTFTYIYNPVKLFCVINKDIQFDSK